MTLAPWSSGCASVVPAGSHEPFPPVMPRRAFPLSLPSLIVSVLMLSRAHVSAQPPSALPPARPAAFPLFPTPTHSHSRPHPHSLFYHSPSCRFHLPPSACPPVTLPCHPATSCRHPATRAPARPCSRPAPPPAFISALTSPLPSHLPACLPVLPLPTPPLPFLSFLHPSVHPLLASTRHHPAPTAHPCVPLPTVPVGTLTPIHSSILAPISPPLFPPLCSSFCPCGFIPLPCKT